MDQPSTFIPLAEMSERKDANNVEEGTCKPTANSPSGQKTRRGDARGGGRTRGARGGRSKRSDMGRAEWSRTSIDKRARQEENRQAAKRLRLNGQEPILPIYATQFSREEIESEPRNPKKKVAVMMGYSGSGYKGMQLNHNERTIEGDLFKALVGAGAISKANADDPKKSALNRCARTDKGVHAAGNIISMKLIVEDPDIVAKINENLSPQIRVFGIVRVNGSFSSYQYCDSRIYEYLIPTHCFLPPHPSSYLGKKLVELAEEANDLRGYEERQEEVSSYWVETEENYIRPVLERVDSSVQSVVHRALYDLNIKEAEKKFLETTGLKNELGEDKMSKTEAGLGRDLDSISVEVTKSNDTAEPQGMEAKIDAIDREKPNNDLLKATASDVHKPITGDDPDNQTPNLLSADGDQDSGLQESTTNGMPDDTTKGLHSKQVSALETAIKQLRSAYISAKKAYRIHPRRLERVRSTLSRYIGTQNYHNYTIDKSFKDASAKRVIKSFVVASDPIIIGDTEWLSLKVHGQSFMMHQIRKMVTMAAMVVRCGCHEGRVQDSYMADKISIPKAPGLGLLLERPVFDKYNESLVGQPDKETVGFKKYEKEMEEFKQREIYERIFREEDRDNTYESDSLLPMVKLTKVCRFDSFFAAMDNLKSSRLLYLSSMGLAATQSDEAPRSSKSRSANVTVLIESDEDEDRTMVDDYGDT
ncbi:MAG: hypothetical protein Q9195_007045 [Heterodermia aff. obscurata]